MRQKTRILRLPELNIAIFSFLLNFVWEMWQIPFFAAMPSDPHWAGVVACTQATFGDVGISLVAFWCVAALARLRLWVIHPGTFQVIGFVTVGVVITVIFEALATGPLARWQYTSAMPTLPILGTGILPLLQ